MACSSPAPKITHPVPQLHTRASFREAGSIRACARHSSSLTIRFAKSCLSNDMTIYIRLTRSVRQAVSRRPP
jgi:hypothetical protein